MPVQREHVGPHSALLPRPHLPGGPLAFAAHKLVPRTGWFLTQVLRVETEVHTGNCISVALKVPLQRGVLLGETGPNVGQLDEEEAFWASGGVGGGGCGLQYSQHDPI